MRHYDILIIGGGAAGIAAAKQCRTGRVLLAERTGSLGGILLRCMHRGFAGELNGPEYAARLLEDFPAEISVALETTVISISGQRTAVLSGKNEGIYEISFSQLILATGCTEIPAGALGIAGTRPSGVYTAGQMQEMMNIYGYVPDSPAVILGSGDIGLVMAYHMALQGIDVTIIEKKDSPGGLLRNRMRLESLPVKIICRETIREIHGEHILTGVILSGGRFIPCSTLLIAAGLTPDRQLIYGMEDYSWIHVCGNADHVHPMVEGVVREAEEVAKKVTEKIRN